MKRQEIIDFLMSKPNASLQKVGNRIIVQYDEPRNVAVWIGKIKKPCYHYIFDNDQRRQAFVAKQKEIGLKEEENEKERLKKGLEDAEKYQPGTILYSSWGYEQINIDFYIILERKPKSVLIQEIGQTKTGDSIDSGTCVPDPTIKVGEPFLKKITKYGYINLNSYSYCGLWDGMPKRWSSYA